MWPRPSTQLQNCALGKPACLNHSHISDPGQGGLCLGEPLWTMFIVLQGEGKNSREPSQEVIHLPGHHPRHMGE